MKKALITGITGQDGSYLAEFLLEKGYEVHGLVRRASTPNFWRIEHIMDKINLVDGDMTDLASLYNAVQVSDPDEVYNLAAQSFVGTSWDQPIYTTEVNALGTVKLLEAVRKLKPSARFYQASTSEMFGNTEIPLQDEGTRFNPKSPYAISKLFAHWMSLNYRECYGMFICSGLLFNHESPRRGLNFVTRRISDGVARIALGLKDKLSLGNLDSKRDWGFAGDYVEAMWLMLQQDEPDDYVVSTGETHSVREFVIEAFKVAGIDDWESHVEQDRRLLRPADVHVLQGNAEKARKVLGWRPRVRFKELVEMMVKADLERLKKASGMSDS